MVLHSRQDLTEMTETERSSPMFGVGDRVTHPMHGAGVIDAVVQERTCSGIRDYYVFRTVAGNLLLKIPVTSAGTVGLRTVIPSGEAEKLIRALPELETVDHENWNKRYREHLLLIKSGDLYAVARVIKSLVLWDHRRGLSTGERRLLGSARKILVSELALSRHADYAHTEAQIFRAMRTGLNCEE